MRYGWHQMTGHLFVPCCHAGTSTDSCKHVESDTQIRILDQAWWRTGAVICQLPCRISQVVFTRCCQIEVCFLFFRSYGKLEKSLQKIAKLGGGRIKHHSALKPFLISPVSAQTLLIKTRGSDEVQGSLYHSPPPHTTEKVINGVPAKQGVRFLRLSWSHSLSLRSLLENCLMLV